MSEEGGGWDQARTTGHGPSAVQVMRGRRGHALHSMASRQGNDETTTAAPMPYRPRWCCSQEGVDSGADVHLCQGPCGRCRRVILILADWERTSSSRSRRGPGRRPPLSTAHACPSTGRWRLRGGWLQLGSSVCRATWRGGPAERDGIAHCQGKEPGARLIDSQARPQIMVPLRRQGRVQRGTWPTDAKGTLTTTDATAIRLQRRNWREGECVREHKHRTQVPTVLSAHGARTRCQVSRNCKPRAHASIFSVIDLVSLAGVSVGASRRSAPTHARAMSSIDEKRASRHCRKGYGGKRRVVGSRQHLHGRRGGRHSSSDCRLESREGKRARQGQRHWSRPCDGLEGSRPRQCRTRAPC
mmetsp:Transcript_18136/g.56931  ORF Transcript_18136/g.56931 Transcript_18136/m.56931 type:complete len:357 (-) Transcript_18136:55-1125(-)